MPAADESIAALSMGCIVTYYVGTDNRFSCEVTCLKWRDEDLPDTTDLKSQKRGESLAVNNSAIKVAQIKEELSAFWSNADAFLAIICVFRRIIRFERTVS